MAAHMAYKKKIVMLWKPVTLVYTRFGQTAYSVGKILMKQRG